MPIGLQFAHERDRAVAQWLAKEQAHRERQRRRAKLPVAQWRQGAVDVKGDSHRKVSQQTSVDQIMPRTYCGAEPAAATCNGRRRSPLDAKKAYCTLRCAGRLCTCATWIGRGSGFSTIGRSRSVNDAANGLVQKVSSHSARDSSQAWAFSGVSARLMHRTNNQPQSLHAANALETGNSAATTVIEPNNNGVSKRDLNMTILPMGGADSFGRLRLALGETCRRPMARWRGDLGSGLNFDAARIKRLTNVDKTGLNRRLA
ncbi:MAG: hypothetical protein JF591_19600 [Lysobacter sp.]|nr:hypothetical protein [Lysobacter sp.]